MSNSMTSIESISLNRLNFIKDLKEGLNHIIRNNLSVVMGQANLIQALIINETDEDNLGGSLKNHSERIEIAGEGLAQIFESINYLEDLIISTDNSYVYGNNLINIIPRIFSGVTRKLSDISNVNIEIISENNENFEMKMLNRQAFDIVLPTLKSLLDATVQSGNIYVSIFKNNTNQGIYFSCQKNLVNKNKFLDNIEKKFEYLDYAKNNNVYNIFGSISVIIEENKNINIKFVDDSNEIMS